MIRVNRTWQQRHGLVLAIALALPWSAIGAQEGYAPVAISEAQLQPIVHTLRLSGTVVASRSARISASVGGLVERMEVDIGDRVSAGDVLIQLDPTLAQHEVQRAQAALNEANAELADAQRRFAIAERLARKGNMPQNELDARQAQVRIGRAVVARLKAEVARERERLDRHTIKAPFAGVIAQKQTEVGEWVGPGGAVVELVATDELRVDIPVPQKYFPRLEPTTPIALQFDALPERHFRAESVTQVPVSDPTARTFTLRVRLTDEDIPLTPGMSAQAEIRLDTGERGVVIPRDAVIRYPDGRTTVWVIDDSGEAASVAERQVELGRAFDGRVHVRRGVTEGESVVDRGNESLRQGQRVRVTNGSS